MNEKFATLQGAAHTQTDVEKARAELEEFRSRLGASCIVVTHFRAPSLLCFSPYYYMLYFRLRIYLYPSKTILYFC